MNAVVYRLMSDLRARWRSRALLAAVVGIVVGVVVTLAAGAYRTETVADRAERALGLAFEATVVQGAGLPLTDEVESLAAVAEAESYTFVFGGLGDLDSGEYTSALVFAGSEAALGARLVSGRDAESDDEFVASQTFMEQTGARLGDQFRLVTWTQEQGDSNQYGLAEPAGPSLVGTLVGVMAGPKMIEDPTFSVIFSRRLLDRPGIGVSQSGIQVELARGADLLQLRTQLDMLPDGANLEIDSAEVISPEMRRAVTTQARASWILAIVVAITATAVIGQMLTRQLRLSSPERRALVAIGFTDGQTLMEVSARAALPIMIGGLAGAALSVACSGWFPMGYLRPLDPSPGPLVQWAAFVVIVVVVIVALLTWVIVWSFVSQTSAKPARPSPTLDAIAGGVAGPAAGVGLRFAFTRASGERGSGRAALAGVLLALAGLVAAITFGASVGRLIDEPFRYGANYDVALGDNGGSAIDPQLADALRTDPDITSLMFYAVTEAHVGATNVPLSALEAVRGDRTPTVLSGELPVAADEIALGRETARDLGAGVGDTIELAGATGTQSFRVTGIVVVSGFGRNDGIGKGGVLMLPGVRRIDETAAIVTAAVTFRPGSDGIDKYIAMLPDGPGEPYRPSAIVNISRVRTIPFILAAVLMLLTLLTVSHGLFTSVRARRRDLAVLRSIGADQRFVSRVVHWQATTFAAVGVALAAPLGFVAGRNIFILYANGIGAVNAAAVPVVLVGGVAVGLVVLANVVAALPAGRARRLTTAAVLQSE